MLTRSDFFKKEYFTEVNLPTEVIKLSSMADLTPIQVFKLNSFTLHAAFPEIIRNPDDWG